MKTQTYPMLTTILAALLLTACGASALTVGDNITIDDGRWASYPGGWWGDASGREDNEVEPYLATMGQSWDLEAFFLDGSTLTVAAGYNILTATGYRSHGDIFLDTGGDWGTGGAANNYGYEYVLDLNLAAQTYSVYELGRDSTFWGTTVVPESNPWRRRAGGTLLASDVSLVDFGIDLAGSAVGSLTTFGGYPDVHTAFSVDLSFLGSQDFYSQLTMNCGNDLLVGHGTLVPDAGATLVLVLAAVMGLGALKKAQA